MPIVKTMRNGCQATRNDPSVDGQALSFVCPSLPFVGCNSTCIVPFVCRKLPLKTKRRFSAGFTLIELIVVLLVVGVLAGIAFPNFRPFIQNQRISAQANDLVTDLAFARSEAIKRASPVTVCKTGNPSPSSGSPSCETTAGNPWTTGRLVFVDKASSTTSSTNDGNGVIDSNEEILRVRQGLEGDQNRMVGEGGADNTANRVTFNPDGSRKKNATASSTGETQWILCDKRGGTQGRAIVINEVGRVRVADKGKDKANSNITCP